MSTNREEATEAFLERVSRGETAEPNLPHDSLLTCLCACRYVAASGETAEELLARKKKAGREMQARQHWEHWQNWQQHQLARRLAAAGAPALPAET